MRHFPPPLEAAKWGRRGVPVNTFVVGREDSNPDAKDIVVTGVECEPSPAPIKTDVTVIGNVNAFGFAGTRLVARVYFDGVQVAQEEVPLDKIRDNKVRITTKAPAKKGEIKVRIEVGQEKDGKIEPLAGELSAREQLLRDLSHCHQGRRAHPSH